jgi:hypothetical protein
LDWFKDVLSSKVFVSTRSVWTDIQS